jgi:hypothetical protein
VIDRDINLFDVLAMFRLNRGDGGFFIDKACVISRDPDDWNNDDVENVGIYRLQVKGPNRLGIQTVPQHHIAIHLAHAEERGEDLLLAGMQSTGQETLKKVPEELQSAFEEGAREATVTGFGSTMRVTALAALLGAA